jgi:hypothetical protein
MESPQTMVMLKIGKKAWTALQCFLYSVRIMEYLNENVDIVIRSS